MSNAQPINSSTSTSIDRTSTDGLDNVFSVQAEPSLARAAETRSTNNAIKQKVDASNLFIPRSSLVNVLEGFMHLLKQDDTASSQSLKSSSNISVITFDEQSKQIDYMKNLLLDAKSTIIELLEEKAKDKAKIAALETQVSYFPDLQAQSDRALEIAVANGDFKLELTKVKCELERFRLSRIRAEIDKSKASILGRITAWWLS